jgi:hypothetical protein
MSPTAVLEQLASAGLAVSVSESGGLLVQPRCLITDDQRRLIRESKDAIIAHLMAAPIGCGTSPMPDPSQHADDVGDDGAAGKRGKDHPGAPVATQGQARDQAPAQFNDIGRDATEGATSTSQGAEGAEGACVESSAPSRQRPATEVLYRCWRLYRNGEVLDGTTYPAVSPDEAADWFKADRAVPNPWEHRPDPEHRDDDV